MKKTIKKLRQEITIQENGIKRLKEKINKNKKQIKQLMTRELTPNNKDLSKIEICPECHSVKEINKKCTACLN